MQMQYKTCNINATQCRAIQMQYKAKQMQYNPCNTNAIESHANQNKCNRNRNPCKAKHCLNTTKKSACFEITLFVASLEKLLLLKRFGNIGKIIWIISKIIWIISRIIWIIRSMTRRKGENLSFPRTPHMFNADPTDSKYVSFIRSCKFCSFCTYLQGQIMRGGGQNIYLETGECKFVCECGCVKIVRV